MNDPTELTPNPDASTSSEPTIAAHRPLASMAYGNRFRIVYAVLGVLFAGASVGLVVLALQPAAAPTPAWSTWAPAPGTVTTMSTQIANHVSQAYRLNASGAQLLAVVPSRPTVTSGTTRIAVEAIAIRTTPNSNAGIKVLTGSDVTQSEMFTFCGLGTHCSILGGKASSIRGRLVRREALEVALYTFKFVPTIKSVIAFMPPAPGTTTSPMLFLRKQNLTKALSEPLRTTLPLKIPPLPTNSDPKEAATIDQLTLPNTFTYSLQALQTGGAAFVLNPMT